MWYTVLMSTKNLPIGELYFSLYFRMWHVYISYDCRYTSSYKRDNHFCNIYGSFVFMTSLYLKVTWISKYLFGIHITYTKPLFSILFIKMHRKMLNVQISDVVHRPASYLTFPSVHFGVLWIYHKYSHNTKSDAEYKYTIQASVAIAVNR